MRPVEHRGTALLGQADQFADGGRRQVARDPGHRVERTLVHQAGDALGDHGLQSLAGALDLAGAQRAEHGAFHALVLVAIGRDQVGDPVGVDDIVEADAIAAGQDVRGEQRVAHALVTRDRIHVRIAQAHHRAKFADRAVMGERCGQGVRREQVVLEYGDHASGR